MDCHNRWVTQSVSERADRPWEQGLLTDGERDHPRTQGFLRYHTQEHLRFYKEGPRHPKQSPRGGGFGSLNWQACDWTLLAFQQLRNFLVFLWGRPEATHLKHSASTVPEEGLESLTLCAGQSSPLRCWLIPGNLFWEFGSTSARGRLPP